MNIRYITLVAPFLSWFIAQFLKPFTHYFKTGMWNWKQFSASGGLPSSHSSVVSSITLAIGFKDGFDSSLFALALVLSCIVAYDAMNVRYFAGENIRMTKLLIDELQEILPSILKSDKNFDRLKEVLGHTVVEVCCGYLLGILITLGVYFFVK